MPAACNSPLQSPGGKKGAKFSDWLQKLTTSQKSPSKKCDELFAKIYKLDQKAKYMLQKQRLNVYTEFDEGGLHEPSPYDRFEEKFRSLDQGISLIINSTMAKIQILKMYNDQQQPRQ